MESSGVLLSVRFGNTGMHWTSSPTNVLSSTGNTAQIDFSGWNVTWNDEPMIPLGEGAWGTNPEGVAMITCGVDCSVGDSYSLYYSAIVPSTAPGAFALVAYELNLVGTITAVPVPAAIGSKQVSRIMRVLVAAMKRDKY